MAGAASVELLAPGLLESVATAHVHCPALQFLLACARHRRLPEAASPVQQLCTAFGISAAEPPAAAIIRQHDHGDAGQRAWMRADPVHVEPGYQGTMHVASPMLNAAEEAELVGAVAGAFTGLGAALSVGRPGCWYLSMAAPPALRTVPPQPVCALAALLPTGPDSRQWHQALNLAQMILHDSAVNERRAARGALTVDSLWCWGSGCLPRVQSSGWTGIYSDEPLARALAALCGLAPLPLPATAAPLCADRAAVVLATLAPGVRTPDELERDWFAPLLAALKRRTLASFCLRTATREFRVTPLYLVRGLWRRRRPLPAWLPD